MIFFSTRNKDITASSPEAILSGLAEDGGLFTLDYNNLSPLSIDELQSLSYNDITIKILKLFYDEFSDEELHEIVNAAYNHSTFFTQNIVPVHKISDHRYVSELFHGKTLAFKDIALSLLPHLINLSKKHLGDSSTTSILTATSGDTGKAAMEAFSDVDNCEISVFFPNDGVSRFQELQMRTQVGANINVYGIHGNFDDAQNAVKNTLLSAEVRKIAANNNKTLATANSINIGRLIPQIVYYFTSYVTLVNNKEINLGDKITISVPTGNFGNIMAAYIASKIGLPVSKLICASNSNDVLTEFIQTGIYDIRNRSFKVTTSPSMDILISSNFERFLRCFCTENETRLAFKSLQENKFFKVSASVLEKIQNVIVAFSIDENTVDKTINSVFNDHHYCLDPHSAVAYAASIKYGEGTQSQTPHLIMATAHPFKFSETVLNALHQGSSNNPEKNMNTLAQIIQSPIPAYVSSSFNLDICFDQSIEITEIRNEIEKVLRGDIND